MDDLDELLQKMKNLDSKNKKSSDDLEEILGDLENFEVKQKKKNTKQTKCDNNSSTELKKKNSLSSFDDVLNELNNLETKKVVTTCTSSVTSKLTPEKIVSNEDLCTCHRCNKPIVSQSITALGKDWHEECFICGTCHIKLKTTELYEYKGYPYCKKDYELITSVRCAYCNGVIEGEVIKALGRSWHYEHFFCAQCGKVFTNKFMEKDGLAYCEEDYVDMFAPKCKKCNKAIVGEVITAMNGEWHDTCFSCTTCNKKFEDGSFYEYENKPYCHFHWCEEKKILCVQCLEPITGKYITVSNNRRFHFEHFNCNFCKKLLAEIGSKEKNGKFYCNPCHLKLFE